MRENFVGTKIWSSEWGWVMWS